VSGGQTRVHVPGAIKREAKFLPGVQVCERDLPGSGAQPAKHNDIRAQLKFAKCMRSHGIADFPDPLPHGGFNIRGDTNSPQFDLAAHACQWTGIHWNGPP
jgi:hypothetical protein